MILDVRREEKFAWPKQLKPVGEGTFDKESFRQWWSRNGTELRHLHSQIAEQWIFRHWDHSPYTFIVLDALTWCLENWPTERIIDEVHIEGWKLDPDFDYEAFNRFPNNPPAAPMNANGTWDYPPVILKTPHGIRNYECTMTEVRYLLIEGHSRLRYLNALKHRARAASSHDLFVLSMTQIGEC